MDFESKWYQQAAAIGEKHKVSLSFKPCAVYCFLFVFRFAYCFFLIVFCLFFLFVFSSGCFFGLFLFVCFLFFNYSLVSNNMKHFAS